jgi:programmed cell death protein 4
MEKCAYERELVSLLLASSDVYSKVITSSQIQEGFKLALDSIEDASLDIPDAPETLAKFLGRAIVDEIIPPKFLTITKASCTKAAEALRIANALYTEAHGSVRLAHIWGPGDLRSAKRLKKEVSLILEEYCTTGDIEEAEKCVRKLNAPSFFFQVIRQALRLAMQNGESNQKKILHLLSEWSKSGLIVPDQMKRGFALTYENLNDIKLDIPHADNLLVEITEIAKQEGFLSKDFVPPAPQPSTTSSTSVGTHVGESKA